MNTVSIIIPAYDSAATIEQALMAVCDSIAPGVEIIVIDDGSTDATGAICRSFPVKLMQLVVNSGPAHARNIGARMAGGDLLVFLDADTCLEEDGLRKILAAFDADPELDGIIGAYDDQPAAPGTLSQFRNLLHCFVHRTARRQASTFWSGCGAIRREVFFAHNGFDESYRRPSIEDLEFGYRLHRAGRRIVMAPEVQVKHLKKWTLGSMLQTDIWNRGIPWTELILRERSMPDDLNLGMRQRLSVLAVFAALLLAVSATVATAPESTAEAFAALLAIIVVLALNRDFYAFLYARKGLRFTVAAAGLHLMFYFYNGLSFLMGIVCWMRACGRVRGLRRRFNAIFADEATH